MTSVDSLPKEKLEELDRKVGIGYFNRTTDFSVTGSGSASMYRVHTLAKSCSGCWRYEVSRTWSLSKDFKAYWEGQMKYSATHHDAKKDSK